MSIQVETIGSATLYCGDCLDVLSTLDRSSAIVSDPPYGMNWDTDSSRFSGGASKRSRKDIWNSRVEGDDKPFDPTPWLAFDEVILWGANFFNTPIGTTLTWIKRNEASFGTFLSDAEIAWMKGGRGVYCFKDVSMNGAGANFPKSHPTQKPVRLMEWCVGKIKQGVIVDPFMGSGTTGVACANLGREFVGIEVTQKYFDAACERVTQAQSQGRLFA